ncbi:GNAT family N-acetyltransferase [Gymnodinialimonas sp. 2305UL16-5]|uniref:GNAT family N-acetyltransferase n=1 Tax=Gymnodinialimonas mytili TaxID=3126503 RepID=UPI0030A20634
MSGPVTLRPLSPEDANAYRVIDLPEDQQVFGGRPAAAFDDLPDCMDLFGIEGAGQPVGLFRIDRDYERYDFAEPGDMGLRFFIVDHGHQGQGIAAAALAALPDLVRRRYPDARAMALTVNLRNHGAYRVYQRAGFVDTGAHYLGGGVGPQHVMRMPL